MDSYITSHLEKTENRMYHEDTTKEQRKKLPHKGGSSNHEKSGNSRELTLD
jgi:hypothetical protein